MADVFTLGESMLRLATSDARRLEEADSLSVAVGGAESNVASNLARLGKKVEWFSRLPDSPLGAQVINTLRRHGVETLHVQRVVGERLGTYFLEYGAAPRGIRVIYDRAESAASHMTPADLPLDAIAASRWLHLTGITPALSASCAETVRAAIAHAQVHQVRIAFDVNYRALLWSPEDAAKQLAPLCAAADVVFVALRDAVSLFHAPNTMNAALHDLQARWGGTIIMTEGEQGASAYDGQAIYSSPAFPVTIVDRIGAGDAFVSGVLCRLLEDAPLDDALRFGAAMSALKLTIAGDIAVVSRAEVETLIGGQGSQLKR